MAKMEERHTKFTSVEGTPGGLGGIFGANSSMYSPGSSASQLLLRTMAALAPKAHLTTANVSQLSVLAEVLAARGFVEQKCVGVAVVWTREVKNGLNEIVPLVVAFEPESNDIEPTPGQVGKFDVVMWCGTVLNPSGRSELATDREEHRRILQMELGGIFHIGSLDHAYRVQTRTGPDQSPSAGW